MMIKLLRAFAVLTGLAVVGVVIVGLLMPGSWAVERSLDCAAAPEALRPLVSDLRRWPDWMSVSREQDPSLVISFSGEHEGAGAVLSWTGDLLGRARLSITAWDGDTLSYALEFAGVEQATQGTLRLEPTADGTRLTRREGGDLSGNPIARLFAPLFEAKLSADFDASLRRLASLAERGG